MKLRNPILSESNGFMWTMAINPSWLPKRLTSTLLLLRQRRKILEIINKNLETKYIIYNRCSIPAKDKKDNFGISTNLQIELE